MYKRLITIDPETNMVMSVRYGDPNGAKMTSNLHHEPLPEIESDIGECGQILQQDGTFIYPEPTEQPVIDLAQLQRIQAEILDNVSRLSSELERISETQEEQARIAKGGG